MLNAPAIKKLQTQPKRRSTDGALRLMPRHEDPFPPPPFEGFRPEALAFFRGLAVSQEKAWFTAHRAEYEEFVREPLQSFISVLLERLAAAKLPFRGDPQRSVFRLNRDVRFSKDKRPYKTHAGVALTRDGGKHSPGVLYFHLDPTGSFAAAGFFRPEPAVLQRLRQGLTADHAAWIKSERALAKAGLTLDAGETLARLPRGFEAAPASIAQALKLKSWIVRKEIAGPRLHDPALADEVVEFALAASPLLSFGWTALDKCQGLDV
jgi:uncharacterized protein (TIGR02453 family)